MIAPTINQPPSLFSPTGGPYTHPDVAAQKPRLAQSLERRGGRALRQPGQWHGLKIRWLHAQGLSMFDRL
jgi:hypothetical protein